MIVYKGPAYETIRQIEFRKSNSNFPIEILLANQFEKIQRASTRPEIYRSCSVHIDRSHKVVLRKKLSRCTFEIEIVLNTKYAFSGKSGKFILLSQYLERDV